MVNNVDYSNVPLSLVPDWKPQLMRTIENSRENARYSSHSKRWLYRDNSLVGDYLMLSPDIGAVIKYLRARESLLQFVESNFRTLFAPALFPALENGSHNRYRADEVVVSRAGLSITLDSDSILPLVSVPTEYVVSEFADLADFDVPSAVHVSRFEYTLKTSLRDTTGSPFLHAFEAARWEQYQSVFGYRSTAYRAAIDDAGNVGLSIAMPLFDRRFALRAFPFDREEFNRARSRYLHELRRDTLFADAARRSESAKKFEAYWAGLKSSVQAVVQPAEVRSLFAQIPMPAPGTGTSRTWGIEVESANANGVGRPAGWDRKYDGSLEGVNVDLGCDCDCDNCYEYGSHEDCSASDNCGAYSETAEFVSPILSSYHSNGLRQLCNDHDGRETNDTPGIHVHVGAGDLSRGDVSRLTRIYSIVSPFLWELTQRNTRGYCKDIDGATMTFWLSHEKEDGKAIDIASDIPSDRYKDLNTHALYGHGTVEFRAMGPVYKYKHLVRWAWLMRELVNVSQIADTLPLFMRVKSFQDVLDIVQTYGSEPALVAFDVDAAELAEV